MNDRAELSRRVQAAHRAGNGQELSAAVAELEAFDRGQRTAAAQSRELDWAGQHVAQRFASGPMNGDRHTFATDWIGDLDGPSLDYRVAMRAEAAGWVRSLSPDVRADREEFTTQALGRARTVASAFGTDMQDAYTEFLRGVTAASGLPQIDQVIDPDNQPSPTPYPTEVFDNFAPEQNDYNGGIEGMNHDSEQASTSAPMFQQLQQMDGSGSGFGSGPERPATHTTQFDTSNSYAEVPLGPPGTIPSAGPGQGTPMHSSAPTPMTGSGEIQDSDPQPASFGSAAQGMTNNSDEERGEHKTGSLYYTAPDPHGFRWLASQGEVFHPFHEACASSHWPEESCSTALVHTASVAIDHSMTLDQARHLAACEAIGAQEGLRALRESRGVVSALAARHNRTAQAWGSSARTMADTAVLHGFQAVVRPVLADASQGCTKCKLGASVIVDGERLCGEHGRQKREAQHQAQQPYDGSSRMGSRRVARDFSHAEREEARSHGDTLPGTDKLPIESHQDLVNAERLRGKVKGASEEKIDDYLDKERAKFGSRGRLDFPLAAEAAFAKGAPFAGYADFAACVADNQDKRDPEAYCGKIKHQVEGSSSLTQIQQTTSPDGSTPTPEADVLPDAVMFPIIPERGGQSDEGRPGPQTYPGMVGSDENKQKEAARRSNMQLPSGAARLFGRMDALQGNKPYHKDSYAYSKQAHGQYLRAWNDVAGMVHGTAGRPIITKDEYSEMTGRPDLYKHYQNNYWDAHIARGGNPEDVDPGGSEAWEHGADASRRPKLSARNQQGIDDKDRCTNCGHGRGCDCPHECTYPANEKTARVTSHGDQCPACGSTNTDKFAHGRQECRDCGHDWGGYAGPKQSSLQDFGWLQSRGGGISVTPGYYYTLQNTTTGTTASNMNIQLTANGFPMGDARPKELLPTGEVVGDGDSDFWEGGGSDTDQEHERGEHKTGAARCSSCGRRSVDGECQGCSQMPSQCPCTPKGRKNRQPLRRRADFMSKPHQSTDDLTPVPNSAATSPNPWSQNADPQSQDYQAGFSEGQQDANSGQRPTFMDNSDRVSSYVKGYAEGYSQAQPHGQPDTGGHSGAGPRQNPDVPRSMGGDSGQAQNSQEALQAAQRAQASRKTAAIKVSAGFVSRVAGRHPDFRKAYAFATKWQPSSALVTVGSAHFEAGLYAGISDRPAAVQQAWIMAHRKVAVRNPRLADRMARHAAFTASLTSSGYRVRKNGVYAYVPQRRTAGTTTDLISDGPGTSPDPMGSTPLNGPGTPPSMGGGGDPARPGGPSPYQGAEPTGRPVVQDDVMGPSAEPPNPVGPLAQGFSGPGPGYGNQNQVPPSHRTPAGADLAPGSPDVEAEPGYSNPAAYKGAPQGGDKVAAFRQRVQGNLAARRQAMAPKA